MAWHLSGAEICAGHFSRKRQNRYWMKRFQSLPIQPGCWDMARTFWGMMMRLCFLYCGAYAPYSKWFGTAFSRLPVDGKPKEAIAAAVSAPDYPQREAAPVQAQLRTAHLHNQSGITEPVAVKARKYFGRDMTVIECRKSILENFGNR